MVLLDQMVVDCSNGRRYRAFTITYQGVFFFILGVGVGVGAS